MDTDQDDVLVVIFLKASQRFVITFRADQSDEAMRTIGRWAADPLLEFTWFDAMKMARSIQAQVGGSAPST